MEFEILNQDTFFYLSCEIILNFIIEAVDDAQ